RTIPVAADGSFAQLMNVSAPGETEIEVRAGVPGQAPRLARIQVKRVVSLALEARDFAAKAKLAFSDLAGDVDKPAGELIVLEGDVEESRTQNHQTVVLVDVQKACVRAPCLARVVQGGEAAYTRGDHLRVYGRVRRAMN